MVVAIGITARAAERTLLGDFDGEVRTIPGKDPAPSLEDRARADTRTGHVPFIIGYSVFTCLVTLNCPGSFVASRKSMGLVFSLSSQSTRTPGSSATKAS